MDGDFAAGLLDHQAAFDIGFRNVQVGDTLLVYRHLLADPLAARNLDVVGAVVELVVVVVLYAHGSVIALADVHEGVGNSLALLGFDNAPVGVITPDGPFVGGLHHDGEGLRREGVQIVAVCHPVPEIHRFYRIILLLLAGAQPDEKGCGRAE